MGSQFAGSPTVGAVAYLNMLPYFFGDDDVVLHRTPQELNRALAAGEVDAGCSSVVAGFELGLEPLWPLAGVGAEAGVRSVYLEPVVASETERFQWQSLRAAFSAVHQHDCDGASRQSLGLAQGKVSEVLLLSSGASAQSLWLCENLLSGMGVHTRVRLIEPSLLRCSPQEILSHLGPSDADQLRCVLAIGDPALRRLYLFPEPEHVLLRFDLGELWRDYTGLPCLFALWFARKGLSESVRSALGERMLVGLDRWNGLTLEQRMDAALAFLERANAHASEPSEHGKSHLLGLGRIMGHSALADYLACLCFDLSAPGFVKSYRRMSEIFRCGGLGAGRRNSLFLRESHDGILAPTMSAERRREGSPGHAQS